jgi:ABC-2 type transport system ATP-binding protein
LIEARRLTRRFGGRTAIEDVSFRVERGEVVGFLGPNGAGKSTTMRILLGVLRPDAGEAVIERPAGYVPESFAGYDALSVHSYLTFMARMKRVNGVDVVIERAGLAGLERRPVGRLSKGQRQRVGLAQALLGSPPSYVLDEPTIGLDPQQIVETREMIRSLGSDAAVLLSTHLLAEAASICDRVVVIVKGRVVAEERPGQAPDLEERFLRLVAESELS